MLHEDVTSAIIGAALEVHTALGPGLLESAYEACLAHELTARGLAFRCQVPMPVVYKGITLECGFRADFIVADAVIIELKAVDRLAPVHEAQLLTYLRLTGLRVGLLSNFCELRLMDGFKRRVL